MPRMPLRSIASRSGRSRLRLASSNPPRPVGQHPLSTEIRPATVAVTGSGEIAEVYGVKSQPLFPSLAALDQSVLRPRGFNPQNLTEKDMSKKYAIIAARLVTSGRSLATTSIAEQKRCGPSSAQIEDWPFCDRSALAFADFSSNSQISRRDVVVERMSPRAIAQRY